MHAAHDLEKCLRLFLLAPAITPPSCKASASRDYRHVPPAPLPPRQRRRAAANYRWAIALGALCDLFPPVSSFYLSSAFLPILPARRFTRYCLFILSAYWARRHRGVGSHRRGCRSHGKRIEAILCGAAAETTRAQSAARSCWLRAILRGKTACCDSRTHVLGLRFLDRVGERDPIRAARCVACEPCHTRHPQHGLRLPPRHGQCGRRGSGRCSQRRFSSTGRATTDSSFSLVVSTGPIATRVYSLFRGKPAPPLLLSAFRGNSCVSYRRLSKNFFWDRHFFQSRYERRLSSPSVEGGRSARCAGIPLLWGCLSCRQSRRVLRKRSIERSALESIRCPHRLDRLCRRVHSIRRSYCPCSSHCCFPCIRDFSRSNGGARARLDS